MSQCVTIANWASFFRFPVAEPQPASQPCFPAEVFGNIIGHLPDRDLVLTRSVSKSWSDLCGGAAARRQGAEALTGGIQTAADRAVSLKRLSKTIQSIHSYSKRPHQVFVPQTIGARKGWLGERLVTVGARQALRDALTHEPLHPFLTNLSDREPLSDQVPCLSPNGDWLAGLRYTEPAVEGQIFDLVMATKNQAETHLFANDTTSVVLGASDLTDFYQFSLDASTFLRLSQRHKVAHVYAAKPGFPKLSTIPLPQYEHSVQPGTWFDSRYLALWFGCQPGVAGLTEEGLQANCELNIFDVQHGSLLKRMVFAVEGPYRPSSSASFDGRYFACSLGSSVRAFSLKGEAFAAEQVLSGHKVESLAFSPTANVLASSLSKADCCGRVRLTQFDESAPSGLKHLQEVVMEEGYKPLRWSPGGASLLVGLPTHTRGSDAPPARILSYRQDDETAPDLSPRMPPARRNLLGGMYGMMQLLGFALLQAFTFRFPFGRPQA
jgi:hypothetical protein